jgi:hypothetical protein
MINSFYVYLHRRATDGKIFYVGKGFGKRAWVTNNRDNNHWKRIARKYGFTVQIAAAGLTENRAFEIEKDMILFFGRDNLCNMTDGGEGVANPSEEVRNAMSEKRKMFFDNVPTARQDQSDRMIAYFSDPAARKAQSERTKRSAGTPEARAANSARRKQYFSDPAKRKEVSEKLKTILGTPEARRINSERQSTPEARAAASRKAKEQHARSPRSQEACEEHSRKIKLLWTNGTYTSKKH